MDLIDGNRAWLTLSSADDYRRIIGSGKYDDNPASHYSWDDTVPNHANVRPGDVVVLWDKKTLIGASVIEQIETGKAIKPGFRCPRCSRANVVSRKVMTPKFRCDDCHSEFDHPAVIEKEVTTYRSTHDQAWVDLEGLLDGATLRSLCVHPKSQNSFRPLRWDAFQAALAKVTAGDSLRALAATESQIAGGHTTRPVRVRLGQPAFRAALFEQYGEQCALTGPCPSAVLEACHLYSYAKVGEHKDQGGLLIRRDLHRLFDLGLLAVDSSGTIDLAEDVRKFPGYAALHGSTTQVQLSEKQKQWLQLHWIEHRSDD
ncbi:HNH endonuclease [Prescottella equi]